MLTLRDYDGVEYPLVATIKHKSELNGTDDLEVTIHAQINKHIDLKTVDKLWEIDFNNVTYKIIHTKQQTKGNGFYLTVRAMPIFYWDFDKSIIHENHNGSHTANSAFSVVFGGSGYNFVLVDFSPAVSWQGFGGGSTRLELFKRLLERYNYEFTIQGKTVYMHHQIGNDTNYVYKYGLNASNVSQSTDATSMFTHIKGFGDFEDREDYFEQANLRLEYTSPLAQLLGTYEGKPIVDGRISRTETMQNAMQQAVEDSLVISVEGNLHDVRKMGYDIAVPLKGDRVWLQDDRLDLETEIRLHTITTTYDVNGEIIGCDVVFGSQTAGERHKAQINTLSKNFSDLLEGNLKLPIISLEQVGRDMIEAIHDASSEITFGDYGMRAISKDNPNHVFGVNSEGWYISQDGGATPRTIATAEGIYADALFAGTLWLTNEMNIESVDGYLNVTGSNFVMQSKNNPLNAVEITPDGITIRGFDGREMFIDGIMQGAVLANVQRFASHLLETSDRNMVLTDPSLTEDGEWENLYVLHDEYKGRYLDLWIMTSVLSGSPSNTGTITFRVRQLGSQNVLYSETVSVDKDTSRNVRPRVDLQTFFGVVPDYRNFSFYIEAKVETLNDDDRIAFRLNTGWFND